MAHPRVIAERNEAARERIRAALLRLAVVLDAEAELVPTPFDRDRDVSRVLELETIAGNLEALAAYEKPRRVGRKVAV